MDIISSSEDRLPPPAVAPVVRDGVTYTQAEDGRSLGLQQAGGVLLASDSASGRPLWTLVVYGNAIDDRLEADAQWLFFEAMAFDADGRLRIVNEAHQTYLVNVHTRQVQALA